MKTKLNTKVIFLISTLLIIAASNVKSQNDYTVDWTDSTTYDVTCGKVNATKWSVKNDSCLMTTPYIRVEAVGGSEVIYTFRVNQSGSGDITDRCYVYHAIDEEDWVLDTLITAGGSPQVFTYNDNVFMNYTHYIRFKLAMRTDSQSEFWSIDGGDLDITDGYPEQQKIMVYTTKPPAPLPGPPTLPVELISFTGSAAQDMVKLNWVTSSETNNDYFTIEKSSDGVFFDIVGYIDGAGTSNILNEYVFYDNYPFDVSYYRLIQTDFDGTSEYSDIISVNAQSQNETDIEITCAGDILYVQANTNKSGPLQINIYDLSGNLVYNNSIEINRNQNQYAIRPTTNFGSIYLVNASFENKKPFIGKVYLN